MRTQKKESLIVLCIVIPVVIMFAFISLSAPDMVVVKPLQQTILTDQDMVLSASNGDVTVGSTTRDEIMAIFPGGTNLGRSGVYHPNDMDLLVTMTRHEDVVIQVDITDSDIATARGIKPNDSVDKVIAKYGPDYLMVYDTDNPDKVSYSYGADQYVVFNAEGNIVREISICAPVDPDLKLALAQKNK